MRARLSGLGLIVASVALAWVVFAGHLHSARAIILVPFCGATGLWLLVFGYPRGADGLAPGWWRLGLVVLVIAACVMTSWALG